MWESFLCESERKECCRLNYIPSFLESPFFSCVAPYLNADQTWSFVIWLISYSIQQTLSPLLGTDGNRGSCVPHVTMAGVAPQTRIWILLGNKASELFIFCHIEEGGESSFSILIKTMYLLLYSGFSYLSHYDFLLLAVLQEWKFIILIPSHVVI